ncbi:alpha/beta fold hydrolase [Sphingosinicella terrae]|uniref:alpha/beta fold hydrolase n=1 Tax=Sphingosinicella terrae TaxID=2172047 RepID=UPI000E0CC80C|nr:alpha/beta hydrolase [Sphingosinicella terrae]
MGASAGAQPSAPGQPMPAISRETAQQIIGDAYRIVQPRGIEETRAVEIGGIRQWISVRGRDRRNPILLFIHGGPGAPEMPASWLYQSPWEDYFTVVQWDQRGAGRTAAANDMSSVVPTITVERMIADGEELVSHLRDRYGKSKIFVLGHSWGSVIGLAIAQRHPDWLHAYIGMGQVIHGQSNERVGYAWALQQARADANQEAIAQLEAIAPYPPTDRAVTPQEILTQRRWVNHYGGLTWGRTDLDYEQNAARLSPLYSEADLTARGQAGATLVRLLPELWQLDLRSVSRLDCPVFIFAGRYDYQTPSSIAADWFSRLSAPHKQLIWFRDSAHMMHLEEPGRVLVQLATQVRSLAAAAGDVPPSDERSASQ